jgi:PEP-CTERM motif
MEGRAMKSCLAVAMFALLAVSGVAQGSSIAFAFHGDVKSVSPELVGHWQFDGPFNGAFGFNSETEDEFIGDPNRGMYRDALGFGHVIVGGPIFFGPDYLAQIFDGDIFVQNNSPAGYDYYEVRAGDGTCGDSEIAGPAANGWELCGFDLTLFDFDSLAFDSDQLPLIPPNLDDFEAGSLRLIFGRPDTAHRPQVIAVSWPNQAGARFFIAEPGTFALFGLGLLGLGMTRRRAN